MERRPAGYRLSDTKAYLAFTVIVLGLTSSAFGRVMINTPASNSAFALSGITIVGREMLRSKIP